MTKGLDGIFVNTREIMSIIKEAIFQRVKDIYLLLERKKRERERGLMPEGGDYREADAAEIRAKLGG